MNVKLNERQDKKSEGINMFWATLDESIATAWHGDLL
jgi:hypothetical protein